MTDNTFILAVFIKTSIGLEQMIRTDGTIDLTPKQKDLFISNTIHIAHSRLTPAQTKAELVQMCEAFLQAPASDDVESVVIEMSAPRLAQLSGMSPGTAQECQAHLDNYGMKREFRQMQLAGGKYATQVLVNAFLHIPQLPQSKPTRTPRAERKREASQAFADKAREVLNAPCPVCGVVGDLHLRCHSCGTTWTTDANGNITEDYGTEAYNVHPGETAEIPTSDPAEGQKTPPSDFSTTQDLPSGESGESGTRSYDAYGTVSVEGTENLSNNYHLDSAPPTPLPAAAPYVPGRDEHPDPLINAIGTEKRFLPCRVIPVLDGKPIKKPVRQGADGKPTSEGWQDSASWMTYYAAEIAGSLPEWDAPGLGVMFSGSAHDLAGIDLDKCVADGTITSERAEQIAAFLNTYMTNSVSGTGLHLYIKDTTHLIPDKFDEKDGIGIYRSSKWFCETFDSFGPVLPVRVITDPAQARTICRVLGVMPTDEMVIAPPTPSHVSLNDTTDRLSWAISLLARLSADRCEYYDSWVRVGMALAEFGTAGLSMWDTWSRGSKKYKPGECESKWGTFDADGRVTLGTLYQYAREDDLGGQMITRGHEPHERR